MNTESYNGWTNFATWCLCMHLNNDAGPYRDLQKEIDSYVNEKITYDEACVKLTNYLQDFVRRSHMKVYVKSECWAVDLIVAAMRDINYDEIVTAELDDYNKRLAAA